MRKQIRNEFRLKLSLSIAAGSRFLIADEKDKEKDNNRPHDEPQVSRGVKSNGEYYLPGSSLKGVLRSRAEYIAGALSGGMGVCHPFDQQLTDPKPACGERFNLRDKAGQLSLPQRYVEACPACQVFGHTFEAGRLRVTDFVLDKNTALKTVVQTHAPIDRMSGGVSNIRNAAARTIFTVEYLTQAAFTGELILENFSLWQIGWLGFLLQDLRDGLIQVGHKQTTGAGKMRIDSASAAVRVLGLMPAAGSLKGLLVGLTDDKQAYSLAEEQLQIPGLAWRRDNFWWSAEFANAASLELLWAATRSRANQTLTRYRFPEAMQLPALAALAAKMEAQA